MSKLLRGGRIPYIKEDVVKFASSIKNDQKLLKSVVAINQAHVIMLLEQKIIEHSVGVKLLQALNKLKPRLNVKASLEDIHVLLEEKVTELCGSEIGGNLHIAKSRNDQVATAIRMELREDLIGLIDNLVDFKEALLKFAGSHTKTLFPGYTHMQPAQPVTFAYYLLSYFDCLSRDLQRLESAFIRVNLCPMGACALAASSFPVNRERVAELLGFSEVLENSIDAVSSRDFILETIAALAILAVDISRLVEDLIVWGSLDFGLIELPDEFSSTSSIMPQKKNPDVLEVIRARMSHVLGNFVTSFTILKALPSGYNLDLQEITPRLWESFEIVKSSLIMLSKLVAKIKVNENALAKPHFNFLAATELANMLVRKYNVPFRSAHKIVGFLVRELISKGLTLNNLTSEMLNKTANSFGFPLNVKEEDILASTDIMKVVESHNAKGGPSPVEVERMLKLRKEQAILAKTKIKDKKLALKKASKKLHSTINSYIFHDEQNRKL